MPSAEGPPGASVGPAPAGGEPDYRFTLANERTFLAYERTAVGLVAGGLAVLHLLEGGWPNRLLGLLLVITGAVAAVGGWLRFRAVERAVRAGVALPPNRVAPLLVAALAVCLAVTALAGLVELGVLPR